MMETETWELQGRRFASVRWMCWPDYRARIVGGIRLSRPLKIVVDSGNGIAGASAPAILRAIGCEVTELLSEVDGNFPEPPPGPEQA
jgi:phosphomannomutase